MRKSFLHLLCLGLLLQGLFAGSGLAQTFTFATVERPPFSMAEPQHRGFSIDLMDRMAAQLGMSVDYQTMDNFGDMLEQVADGSLDGAIANISITAAREEVMDFTLPIFESGVQLMVSGGNRPSLWQQIITFEIVAYLLIALAALFGIGMLMWVFERRKQPYFQHPARDALFPAFWWSLNLLVNGGFEERQPRSVMGRVLAVVMVFSSLFVVSVFVARITAAMTVSALTSTVTGLNDLDMRTVGSVTGSTASQFLEARSVRHTSYDGFAGLIDAFENDEIDVVVFDGPLLRHYLSQDPMEGAYLVEHIFQREDYGIALPSGSPLREPLNQAILTLRENGSYSELERKWFGAR